MPDLAWPGADQTEVPTEDMAAKRRFQQMSTQAAAVMGGFGPIKLAKCLGSVVKKDDRGCPAHHDSS